jgi:TolB-like protein
MSFIKELKRRNVIRVAVAYVIVAWVLLQVSDTLVPALHLPEWFHSGIALLLILGFPLAMIFAWAYELTPEGLRKEKDVDRSASVTHVTGRKLDFAIITALVLALVYFVYDEFVIEPAQESESAPEITAPEVQHSIAVLSFKNMSSNTEYEYFSDGVSEEILNELAKIPGLQVAASTSSFYFKGRNTPISEIGRELNVGHVVSGSVRRAGNRLRINAQLISVESGFNIWSETFERDLTDVFAIQDEISRAIANAFKLKLMVETDSNVRSTRTKSVEAYSLYLQGRSLLAQRDADLFPDALRLFDEASRADPDYADPFAAKGLLYSVAEFYDYEMPFDESTRLALEALDEALRLDPGHGTALVLSGVVRSGHQGLWLEGLSFVERALAIEPGNIDVQNFSGDFFIQVGDLESAIYHQLRAIELDPLSGVHRWDLSFALTVKGDIAGAIARGREALLLAPGNRNAIRTLAAALLRSNGEGAADLLEELRLVVGENDPSYLKNCADLAWVQSRGSDSDHCLNQLKSVSDTGVPAQIASHYVLRGDFDTAGEYLLDEIEADNTCGGFVPDLIRLPEQAPESAAWQLAWSNPSCRELAKLRRDNGLDPEFKFTD